MTDPIYHITSRAAWSTAQETGAYSTESLSSQGFIHCSTADQVVSVANAIYRRAAGLVLLEIDPVRLQPLVRWEPGADKPGELFPHIYGLLNLDAVTRVLDFPPNSDGSFTLPPL